MSSLLLHGKTPNAVRFDAEVVAVMKSRGEENTTFRMITNVSRKEYSCTASFAIPVREGDKIVGGGVLESKEDYRGRQETWVRITQMPMVRPDTSKEGLLRTFLMKLRGCSSLKAREIYQWIEDRLSGDSTCVASWLDTVAEGFCRDGTTEIERELHTAFPTLEIDKFIKWWHHHSSVRRLYLLGLTAKEVKKIYLPYDKAYEVLLENPYLLVDIPLDRCDKVLEITKVVLPPSSRACGRIARVLLDHVQDRQWCCTPLNILYNEVPDAKQHMPELQRILFPDADSEGVKPPRGYECMIEYDCIYLHHQYDVEQGFATQLKARVRSIEASGAYFRPEGRQPSDDQRMAVDMALHRGVSCITGYAGVGKTTVITFLRENLDLQQKGWVALSFTGKAVSRIKDVIKCENVYTIHRVLSKELPKVTVALIDESSMVETALLYRFLRNHPQIDHLIFLGDPRQLLPIGAGSLFTQILQSSIPITCLTKQHRQQTDVEEDYLYINLQNILRRQEVVAGSNFTMNEGGVGAVLKVANELHDQGKEVVVLSPTKAVVEELNPLLRDIVNANSPRVIEPKSKREWRLHDRVLMQENSYDINVMNGEEGKIVDLDDDWIEVKFRSGKHRIPFDIRPEYNREEDEEGIEPPVSTKMLKLAYSLTIHKSQGSEYPDVIIYITENTHASGFFCNNMVYVASSRTKQRCHVVGNIKEFQLAIRHESHSRYENLARRLSE